MRNAGSFLIPATTILLQLIPMAACVQSVTTAMDRLATAQISKGMFLRWREMTTLGPAFPAVLIIHLRFVPMERFGRGAETYRANWATVLTSTETSPHRLAHKPIGSMFGLADSTVSRRNQMGHFGD